MSFFRLCVSNLHLVQWKTILIDHHQQYHQIRCRTLRGDSIFNLQILPNIGKKISLIDRTENEKYWSSKSEIILTNIFQLLSISNTQNQDFYYEFR